MAALSNNAEGGANGVTVLVADTGSGDPWTSVNGPGTAGIIQYTNALVGNGSLGYRIATRGTAEQEYLAWTLAAAGATWYGRAYVAIDVLSTTVQFIQLRQSAGGGVLGYISFNSPAKWAIRNGSDSASQYTSTITPSLSTMYRVEFAGTAGGATGTIQVRIYAGNSVTLLEDSGAITVTQSVSFTTWQYARYGVTTSVANLPSTTGYVYLDDLRLGDATWPGPAVSTSQFLRPNADVIPSGWSPSVGTALWSTLDETPADDSDFVTSPSSRLVVPRPKRVLRPHDDLPSRRRRVVIPCR